jgi:penicillin amidase
MAGKMPIRRPGHTGMVPLPGWDPENDWRGFARLEDLPRTLDPPEGFLATANDDLNYLGALAPINLCVASYRAERIRNVLSEAPRVSLGDMEALHFDLYSTQAERFMAILDPILAELSDDLNARLLRDWDCRYHDDSRAATLFERFYRTLLEEVFGGRDGSAAPRRLGIQVVDHLFDETTLMGEYYGAFDRILLAEQSLWFGGCKRDEIYRSVLCRILPAEARPYGEQRRVVFRHLLLGSKLPRFLGFDRGPITLKGGRATVHQGQLLRGHGRLMASGPSYRFVADLATDELRSNLPGGPSDRRFSRWYTTGLIDWWKGKYRVLRGIKKA